MAADDLEDVDVATKAPESDAQEDTAHGSKPAMGEHCVSDRPAPSGVEAKGEMTTLNGIDVYISKPQFYPSQPAKLLLLLSPGTGIHSTNNQLQADSWAEAGYVVVMPDQFGGDAVGKMDTTDTSIPLAEGGGATTRPDEAAPTTTDPAPSTDGAQPTPAQGATEQAVSGWVDRIKQTVLDTAKSFRIDMWLARHTPATVLPRLLAVLDSARDVYADAVAYGGGVYGAGYCFGGRYVLLLLATELPADAAAAMADGKTTDEESGTTRKNGGGPYLKAAVLAHGTSVGREDFAALGGGGRGGDGAEAGPAEGEQERAVARLGIVAVKDDPLFTDEVRDYGVKLAADKGVDVQERVWEGVPHGFAVVGEYQDQKIVKAQSEAHGFMVDFLAKS